LKVLFATEAAEGIGHIYPWIELFKVLIAQGIELHVACPFPRALEPVLNYKQVKLHQAWFPSMHTRLEAENCDSWEEVLKSLGYTSVPAVGACLNHWLKLMRAIHPSIVLGDYSPIAAVAAATVAVPTIQLGSGYCTPPRTADGIHLLPHKWITLGAQNTFDEQLSESYLAKRRLQATFSNVFKYLNLPNVDDPTKYLLQYGAERFVATEPILDPYSLVRPPDDCRYIGHPKTPVITNLLSDEFPDWRSNTSRLKVLVYLKRGVIQLEQVVQLLQSQSHWDSAFLTQSQPIGFASTAQNVKLIPNPVNLATALDECDVFVTNGGLYGLSEALKKNKLIVIVPSQAEQAASAIQLGKLATVKVALNAEAICEAIKRLSDARKFNRCKLIPVSNWFVSNRQAAELVILSRIGAAMER
jgi:hypothetical protein